MSDQGDHVVLQCQSPSCGMRYPSPSEDPRRDACPLCEAPTAEVDRFAEPPDSRSALGTDGSELIGVLDNIRSALNVGMMLRSADGAGLSQVWLGGLTAPADHPKVRKSSLGAEASVATSSYLDLPARLAAAQARGVAVWAVDFTNASVPVQSLRERPRQLAFVVGSERAGVDPEILRTADRHVHLDMYGSKTTVNVGVAFGTVAYSLRHLRVAGE